MGLGAAITQFAGSFREKPGRNWSHICDQFGDRVTGWMIWQICHIIRALARGRHSMVQTCDKI